MSLRGTGGTGDHLRPKAPCAGPLAIWYLEQLAPSSGFDCSSQTSRGLCLCSLCHARSPAEPHSSASGSVSGAHDTGTRVREAEIVSATSRTCKDSDRHASQPYDRKPSGSNLMFRPDGLMFHVKQSAESYGSGPFSNARLNLRRSPQNLFCACFGCTNTGRARLSLLSGSSFSA